MRTIISSLFLAFLLAGCFSPAKNDHAQAGDKDPKDSCCIKDTAGSGAASTTTAITCPKCGYKKTETMPTDMCVLKYTCEKCNTELRPKEGDCCVYCSYGTHKCPSKQ